MFYYSLILFNLFCLGHASLHICKPGGAWHAWDYIGFSSRYLFREDIWWQWKKDSLLWVPTDHATGFLTTFYFDLCSSLIRFYVAFNWIFWFRVSRVFKVGYVCQAWGGQFHTREQLLGKYSMKKRTLIVSALCSSTGPLFETSKIICFYCRRYFGCTVRRSLLCSWCLLLKTLTVFCLKTREKWCLWFIWLCVMMIFYLSSNSVSCRYILRTRRKNYLTYKQDL